MKKVILYFIAFIVVCFFLPAILTKKDAKFVETSSKSNNETIENTDSTQENIKSTYNYKNYGTIKLLHKKTGEVEQVNIDDYLCNVVSAEMPADYEIEALKAQAVVARTYTIYKINNKKQIPKMIFAFL